MLLVLLGIGAILLIGGGAVGAYFAFFDEEEKKELGTTQAKGESARNEANEKATTGWIEIHDSVGRYRIKFPAAPRIDTKKDRGPNGAVESKEYSYENEALKEGFFCRQVILPPGVTKDLTDDQKLEQIAARFKKDGTTIQTKSFKYQGFACREIIATNAGEPVLVTRLIWAETRVLILVAGGENHAADSPRLLAFFESLRIE
jgi:hypothetical protein